MSKRVSGELLAQSKRFAMRQRLFDLGLVAATTVDLHFIVLHRLFDIRVVRDVRIGRERVVHGQLLDERVEMGIHEDAFPFVLLFE